ncbi:hypothetical protein TNCT_315701 [Trichonephila clavata]|uniref:Uncharacterized protein n=1 Tax=Trichonephila clavata TaxID=2740835 RepID=A0A8X6FUC5_TRICU|nr:hypothetical protein TNCT_315701 [Trichonephila clavata]
MVRQKIVSIDSSENLPPAMIDKKSLIEFLIQFPVEAPYPLLISRTNFDQSASLGALLCARKLVYEMYHKLYSYSFAVQRCFPVTANDSCDILTVGEVASMKSLPGWLRSHLGYITWQKC